MITTKPVINATQNVKLNNCIKAVITTPINDDYLIHEIKEMAVLYAQTIVADSLWEINKRGSINILDEHPFTLKDYRATIILKAFAGQKLEDVMEYANHLLLSQKCNITVIFNKKRYKLKP